MYEEEQLLPFWFCPYVKANAETIVFNTDISKYRQNVERKRNSVKYYKLSRLLIDFKKIFLGESPRFPQPNKFYAHQYGGWSQKFQQFIVNSGQEKVSDRQLDLKILQLRPKILKECKVFSCHNFVETPIFLSQFLYSSTVSSISNSSSFALSLDRSTICCRLEDGLASSNSAFQVKDSTVICPEISIKLHISLYIS